MRSMWTPVALWMLTCPPLSMAASTDDELAALRAEVARLSARLDAIESRPRVTVDELVTTAAVPTPSPATLQRTWAENVALKGDLRYRYDDVYEEGDPDRPRHRMRARLGADAALADNLNAYLRFATGGGDPRSANQTLGDVFSTKDIGIDLGYFDWEALPGLHALGGKMTNPLRRVGDDRFTDADVNPEGLAFTWARGPLFAAGIAFTGFERAADDDTWVYGGQAGFSGDVADNITLTTGVTYANWTEVQGLAPFFDGNPNGNSVDTDGTLLYDFDLVDGFAEVAFPLFGRAFSLYGQYGVNTQADEGDTAYAVGFLLGNANGPRTWEFGYSYNDHGKDAIFAQVVDSDFADGETDAKGHVFHGGIGVAKNVTVDLTYYANEVEVEQATRHDYDRLLLDLSFKY